MLKNRAFARCAEPVFREFWPGRSHDKEITSMQLTFRSHLPVGLALTAGAIGAAAMLATAAAPTARADAFTDIINAVNGDVADGQAAFTTAYADFGSNELVPGLTAFFSGVDDDLLSAPDNLLVGTAEALTNETVTGSTPFSLGAPTDFADGLSLAEAQVTEGDSFLAAVPSDLANGFDGYALYYDVFGSDLTSVISLQELLLGSVAAL
jgi:hypothetical protein